MKDRGPLFALIILLIIILLGAMSCKTDQQRADTRITDIVEVKYKGCEYLALIIPGGYSITHKGNCKNHDKN